MKGNIYFDKILMGAPFKVEELGAKFGKGAVCTRHIAADESFFTETPFAIQQIESKAQVVACENCLRCLDTPSALLAKMTDGEVKLDPRFLDDQPIQVLPCLNRCGEYYCSEKCLMQSFEQHHRYLCVGTVDSEEHSLYQFKKHAYESNEVFILAAKLIMSIVTELQNGKSDLKSAIDVIYKKFWWDVVLLPEDERGNTTPEAWADELKGVIKTSYSLFCQALFQQEYSDLFTFEYYAQIVGMFELNDYGIVVEPQLREKVEQFAEESKGKPQMKKFLTQIKSFLKTELKKDLVFSMPASDEEWIERFMDAIPFIEGNAFGPIVACMNHNCDPNVFVQYKDNKDAHLVALRDIEPGEQLFIAYIDVDEPLEVRRKELAEHGFVCDCPKCAEETAMTEQ